MKVEKYPALWGLSRPHMQDVVLVWFILGKGVLQDIRWRVAGA